MERNYRQQQNNQATQWVSAFVIISLLLHVGVFAFLYFTPLFYQGHTPVPPKQEVVFVNPNDFLPSQSKSLPLVDIAKPKVQKRPKKARFASQYDSTVKNETVAKKIPKKADPKKEISEAPKRPKAKKKKPKDKTVAKRSPAPSSPAKVTDTSKSGKKGGSEHQVSLNDLELKTSDMKDLLGDSGKGKKPRPVKEDGLGQGTELTALPRSPAKSGPGDKFVHDFLPGVKLGDKTYLNTAAMPNVQYFVRLKRIFRLRFNPSSPLRSHFRHNRVAVGKVNVTMGVEVAPSGQLKRLFVIRSSGITGYDQEALRTVRQSAPFSAPPKNIRGDDGILRMTWHFTTYL